MALEAALAVSTCIAGLTCGSVCSSQLQCLETLLGRPVASGAAETALRRVAGARRGLGSSGGSNGRRPEAVATKAGVTKTALGMIMIDLVLERMLSSLQPSPRCTHGFHMRFV